VTPNCGATNLRITYWGGWMDDGRIDVPTDHGESYTCAERKRERECSCPTCVYSEVVYNIHTRSKPDVS